MFDLFYILFFIYKLIFIFKIKSTNKNKQEIQERYMPEVEYDPESVIEMVNVMAELSGDTIDLQGSYAVYRFFDEWTEDNMELVTLFTDFLNEIDIIIPEGTACVEDDEGDISILFLVALDDEPQLDTSAGNIELITRIAFGSLSSCALGLNWNTNTKGLKCSTIFKSMTIGKKELESPKFTLSG